MPSARALLSFPGNGSLLDTLQRHLCLALELNSLELLSFVCAHGALKTASDDVKGEAIELAVPPSIAIKHSLAAALRPLDFSDPAFLQKAFLQAVKEESVHPAIILASAGASENATNNTTQDSLHLAVSKGSLELASVLLESNISSKAIRQNVNGILELAKKEKSKQLELVTSYRGKVATADEVLRRAMGVGAVDDGLQLTLAVCRAGALTEASSSTVADVLAFAVGIESVELSIAACNSGALSRIHAGLTEPTLYLALGTGSVELAIVACRESVLNIVTPDIVRDILQLGLELKSVELVQAVVSKTGAGLTIRNKPISHFEEVLQFAVDQASPELASIICKAGAVAVVDNELLNSTLEMAIETSSNDLLSFLSLKDVLRQSCDRSKEKVLCQAAITGDLQLMNYCISSGVLPQR